MTWTRPKTWVTGEALTASDLNVHLRDNLDALKSPPTNQFNGVISATSSSVTFVDIDPALELELATAGGDVLVGISTDGVVVNTATIGGAVRLLVDGLPGPTVTQIWPVNNARLSLGGVYLIDDLDAAVHRFKLQWAVLTNGHTISSPNSMWRFFARKI